MAPTKGRTSIISRRKLAGTGVSIISDRLWDGAAEDAPRASPFCQTFS